MKLYRGKEQVDEVIEPILVIQAEQDKMIDPQSAIIYMNMLIPMKRILNGMNQDM